MFPDLPEARLSNGYSIFVLGDGPKVDKIHRMSLKVCGPKLDGCPRLHSLTISNLHNSTCYLLFRAARGPSGCRITNLRDYFSTFRLEECVQSFTS